jgi:hypothetical protein
MHHVNWPYPCSKLLTINNENDNTGIGVVEYTVQETWSCGKQQHPTV